MPCEHRRYLLIPVCVVLLFLLRQGLLWLDSNLDIRTQQAALIEQHALDPAALFYTELEAALAAEKRVRSLVHAPVSATPTRAACAAAAACSNGTLPPPRQ